MLQVEGDMTVDAVGLVAVQTAHERRRIVNRHRRLGLAVQLHDGRIETLPRDALHVGHHMQRRAEHRPVDGDEIRLAPAAAQHRGDKRGESSAHTRFPHNFHLFSRKNTIFPINLLFLDAKLKIIVNYEL